MSPGDGHWGTWTEWKNCPRGSYATAFRLRFEPSQGKSGDDSGLNAVHLRCNSLNGSETRLVFCEHSNLRGYDNLFSHFEYTISNLANTLSYNYNCTVF